MSKILNQLQKVKNASYELALLDESKINKVLQTLADILKNNTAEIISANQIDLKSMQQNDPKYDRLLLNPDRIKGIADGLLKIVDIPFPVGQILEERTLPNGLLLKKISVPFGVIAVIYESRPNVTIDVFGLCLKSGNACVLKGGKEAQNTNIALSKCIKQALDKNGLNSDYSFLMPTDRETLHELLQATQYVDLCIPRGGKSLIEFIKQNSLVPVIETGAGIVHTYFDESANLGIGLKIILNAKTRRVSVCNALDTLIIHEKRLKDLPELLAPMVFHEVEIRADSKSFTILKDKYPDHLLMKATEEDFGTEFLSYKMSIKTVVSIKEAIDHIRKHSSSHSEAIIAEDQTAINTFIGSVDAAVCYVNTSTAFTDGGEFGMGAEIGISTQKLHARGPMGLHEINSYKWIVIGSGQIRK